MLFPSQDGEGEDDKKDKVDPHKAKDKAKTLRMTAIILGCVLLLLSGLNFVVFKRKAEEERRSSANDQYNRNYMYHEDEQE